MTIKNIQYNQKYNIVISFTDYQASFQVYEAINYDLDDMELVMNFCVKSDGCANVEYNTNDVLTHFCSPKNLTAFYDMQIFMYETALEYYK